MGVLVLGFQYFKGQPTDYILRFTSGRRRAEGLGLAFYYFTFNTQIVAVPTVSIDASFVFNEVTNNFQEVTIQGQLTYRIMEPKRAAELLNLRIDPAKYAYASDDLKSLSNRIVNVVRIETRAEIEKRALADVLRDSQGIAGEVAGRMGSAAAFQTLGIELLNVYFLSAKPTPEVGKALEAEYRETLLRKADEAIYARRGAAVDEERKIKERELASDLALEAERAKLIVKQGENALAEAENRGAAMEKEAAYRAKALEKEMAVLNQTEPRVLLAAAVRDLAANAGKVGNLTITSEMLASLLQSNSGQGS